MPSEYLTAFPLTEQNLKDLIQRVDVERFQQERIPACASFFKDCAGMCCSLPVAVTKEEAGVLEKLTRENTQTLRQLGLRLRGSGVWTDPQTQRRYLSKKRRGFAQLNRIIYSLIRGEKKTFPFHYKIFSRFLSTCVFSLQDGACALQRLSQKEGRHPWYYKPVNCWKFPLSIDKGSLTLQKNALNPSFPCSRRKDIPAAQGLKEELLFLGKIMGRDIIKEIHSPPQKED